MKKVTRRDKASVVFLFVSLFLIFGVLSCCSPKNKQLTNKNAKNKPVVEVKTEQQIKNESYKRWAKEEILINHQKYHGENYNIYVSDLKLNGINYNLIQSNGEQIIVNTTLDSLKIVLLQKQIEVLNKE